MKKIKQLLSKLLTFYMVEDTGGISTFIGIAYTKRVAKGMLDRHIATWGPQVFGTVRPITIRWFK